MALWPHRESERRRTETYSFYRTYSQFPDIPVGQKTSQRKMLCVARIIEAAFGSVLRLSQY